MTLSEKLVHSDAVFKHLEHYGVHGQKWGVKNKSSGKSKSSNKTQYQKAPSRLSDDELNKRIKRMDLEKKYNDLKAPTKSSGKKYAHDLLGNTGKTVAGTIAGGVVSFGVQKALKTKFG